MHEIIKIPLEQMYKKDTSSTKTTEKVGGHCNALLEVAAMSRELPNR